MLNVHYLRDKIQKKIHCRRTKLQKKWFNTIISQENKKKKASTLIRKGVFSFSG